MNNKIKQTLGLAIATIAGCGNEVLKYDRDNISVEAVLKGAGVERIDFNSGCYRVVADKKRVGYTITIKREVDFVTGIPLEGRELSSCPR